MPTETRLLYLLADLAYIAKLNPSKKPHEFNLTDFRQINGEFLDENLLIGENLSKLVSKLEAGSYKLILPDFLFTSTVVNPELEDEAAVKKYLNEKLLPDLNIDKNSFYLDTTILSHYKGAFKVQLTALEKVVVLPLVKALKERSDIEIESVSPLSWTTKSLISLEPSVSILQLGRQLYLAQHYIGLDQCFHTNLDEAAKFAETVKTLKGVEPNLQTLYLLSNELVDNKIKEALKETLPVQQLADHGQDTDQLPSHLKKIIEAGAKTVAVPEFLLPQFELDLDFDQEIKEESVSKKEKKKTTKDENLVKPAVIGETTPSAKEEVESKEPVEEKIVEEATLPEPEKLDIPEVLKKEEISIPVAKKVKLEGDPETKTSSDIEESAESAPKTTPKTEIKEVDLAQFANLAIDPSVVKKEVSDGAAPKKEEKASMTEPKKEVIKNESEANGMLKMIFIALLSFVVTIGLGIGIGLGYLQLSNNKTNQEPVVEVEAPSPTPTVEPTPIPVEINKEDYALMVVNATTTAGYAGEIADKLEEAGFSDVSAKNAKGTYDAVNYLLVKSLEDESEASNAALLQEMEAATDLVLELSDEIDTEDSAGSYDGVLVLGE